MKRITHYIIFSVITIIALDEPIELVFYKIIKEHFSYIDDNEGQINFQLNKIYPESSNKNKVWVSLHKTNLNKNIHFSKDKLLQDEIYINQDDYSIFLTEKGEKINGIFKLQSGNKVSCILANSKQPIMINNLNSNIRNELVVLTKNEFYSHNIKLSIGLGLTIAYIMLVVLSSYYKKMISKKNDDEKKSIIILPK